jgi:histidinol-phosphatase (PHP family)
VLGSIHYQVSDYRKRFYTGDTFSYQQLYYDHLAQSAESGLFDTLAHPDLVKNESPDEWDFARIQPDIARALDTSVSSVKSLLFRARASLRESLSDHLERD